MKRILSIAIAALMGCTSMQVTTPATAVLKSDTNRAFSSAMRAVQDANFVLKDSDRETGFIYATKGANPLTSNAKEVFLSISVLEGEGGGSTIQIRSTLPGQMVAYGATRGLIEDYCRALVRIEPTAEFVIDGKQFVP